MKKKCLLAMLILLGCIACSCKSSKVKQPTSTEFDALSGKDLSSWQYVQTKEDFEHLVLFTQIYKNQYRDPNSPFSECRIPQTIHFIWIGPKPFPRASVDNVRTWIAKHPDWTIKFWTDRERPLPVPGMQYASIHDLPLIHVRECFQKSDNYAEKSDLLRLEILYQEGGIYVDHDVKCCQSFDPLNATYDFYCGIDMPFQSSLPSCIYPTNNVIGAKAEHPILFRSMELLNEQWDSLQEAYPGTDRDAILNRVLHRTFWLFGEGIKQMHNKLGTRDIVFPAYYFDAPNDDLAIWSRHLYAGTWHETETPFEKMTRKRLMYLSKKSNKTLLLISVLSGLNLLGLLALFYLVKNRTVKKAP